MTRRFSTCGYIVPNGTGSNGPGIVLGTVEEYDPATNTWRRKASMPTERGWLAANVVNGKIYVIGGGDDKARQALSMVESYDPVADKWTPKADMPTPRSTFIASVAGGQIYVIGGFDGNVANPMSLAVVEAYDPVANTWARKSAMPTPRDNAMASTVDGKVYVIGGFLGNALVLSTVEEYTPEGWPFAVSPRGKLATTWGEVKRSK